MKTENMVYEFRAGKSIGPDNTRKKTKVMAPNGQQIVAGDIIDVEAFGFSGSLVKRYIKEKRFIPSDKAVTKTPNGSDVAEASAAATVAQAPQNFPVDSWTKAAIVEYLRAKEVEFDPAMKKAPLLEMAQEYAKACQDASGDSGPDNDPEA